MSLLYRLYYKYFIVIILLLFVLHAFCRGNTNCTGGWSTMDLNCDGIVNLIDFGLFHNEWGTTTGGEVANVSELVALSRDWLIVDTGIIYVNQVGGADSNNGATWSTPFATVTKALSVADIGDQIWIAKGVYRTSDISGFLIGSGVSIYGGFSGGEHTIDGRDLVVNVTTLSGDIDGNDPNPWGPQLDNASHVIVVGGDNIINGIHITNGVADASLFGGGGIFFGSVENVQIENCVVYNNNSRNIYYGGGGAFIHNSKDISFCNCLFYGNSAANDNDDVFTAGKGGAIYGLGSDFKLINCTLSDNLSGAGGGIYIDYGSLGVVNSILWGNGVSVDGQFDYYQQIETTSSDVSIKHSCIQIAPITLPRWFMENGNLSDNPLFVSPNPFTPPYSITNASADYHLRPYSPLINYGNTNLIAATTDLEGKPRVYEGIVDMGAYEYGGALEIDAGRFREVAYHGSGINMKIYDAQVVTGYSPQLEYKWEWVQGDSLTFLQVEIIEDNILNPEINISFTGDPNILYAVDHLPIYLTLTVTNPDVNGLVRTDIKHISITSSTNLQHGPTVDVGEDLLDNALSTVTLEGVITDDRLPFSGQMIVNWSLVAAPYNGVTRGKVFFDNYAAITMLDPNGIAAVSTLAHFTQTGTYFIRLAVSDGQLTATDYVTVEIKAPYMQPQIDAGMDRSLSLSDDSQTIHFDATCNNYNIDTTTFSWQQVSGPDSGVVFEDRHMLNGGVTFSEVGYYVFSLQVDDAISIVSDIVSVYVARCDSWEDINVCFNGGSDQCLSIPNKINLQGISPYPNTYWVVAYGPGDARSGEILFEDKFKLDSAFTVTVPGFYDLYLQAILEDGSVVQSDITRITANPEIMVAARGAISSGSGHTIVKDKNSDVWATGGGGNATNRMTYYNALGTGNGHDPFIYYPVLQEYIDTFQLPYSDANVLDLLVDGQWLYVYYDRSNSEALLRIHLLNGDVEHLYNGTIEEMKVKGAQLYWLDNDTIYTIALSDPNTYLSPLIITSRQPPFNTINSFAVNEVDKIYYLAGSDGIYKIDMSSGYPDDPNDVIKLEGLFENINNLKYHHTNNVERLYFTEMSDTPFEENNVDFGHVAYLDLANGNVRVETDAIVSALSSDYEVRLKSDKIFYRDSESRSTIDSLSNAIWGTSATVGSGVARQPLVLPREETGADFAVDDHGDWIYFSSEFSGEYYRYGIDRKMDFTAVQKISTGDRARYAIVSDSGCDGKLASWGSGYGDDKFNDIFPVYLPSGEQNIGGASHEYLEGIKDVDAGLEHLSVIEDYLKKYIVCDVDGKVFAAGDGHLGQMGNGHLDNQRTPVEVKIRDIGMDPNNAYSFTDAVQVKMGFSSAMALTRSGDLYTWGTVAKNGYAHTALFAEKTILKDIVSFDVAQGYRTSSSADDIFYAADKNGHVWSWGANNYGQDITASRGFLANGHLQNEILLDIPYRVLAPDSNNDGLPDDVNGRNHYDPSKFDTTDLDKYDPNSNDDYLLDIIQVASGSYHTLALDKHGHVWAWGRNKELGGNVLGTGKDVYYTMPSNDVTASTHSYYPVQVKISDEQFLSNIVYIEAGNQSSFAVDKNGDIWVWGLSLSNSDRYGGGQLGLGNDPYYNNGSYYAKKIVPINKRIFNQDKKVWYKTIQRAIDDADPNNTIVVQPGVYTENLIFDNKHIRLVSSNPYDLKTTLATIIGGDFYFQPKPTVTMLNGDRSYIAGFTFNANLNYSVSDATNITEGIYCYQSSPTLTNNIYYIESGAALCFEQCGKGIVKNSYVLNHSIVSSNGFDVFPGAIIIRNPEQSMKIHNLSIMSAISSYAFVNEGVSIYAQPEIRNCLIWSYHDYFGDYLSFRNIELFTDIKYCCFDFASANYEDLGNNQMNIDYRGNGIINYTGPSLIHLFDIHADHFFLKNISWPWLDAIVIDKGDPELDYSNQFCSRGHKRVLGDRVDIGAEEYAFRDDTLPFGVNAGSDVVIEISNGADEMASVVIDDADNAIVQQWFVSELPNGVNVSDIIYTVTEEGKLSVDFDTATSNVHAGRYVFNLRMNSDPNGLFLGENYLGEDFVTIDLKYAPAINAPEFVLLSELTTPLSGIIPRLTIEDESRYHYRWRSVGLQANIFTPEDIDTYVTFPSVGLYHFIFEVLDKYNGNILGEADKNVIVGNDTFYIDACEDKIYVEDHASLPISLDALYQGQSGVTFEWDVLTKPSGANVSFNEADNATATITAVVNENNQVGEYVFGVAVKYADLIVGYDTVTIEVVTSAPQVFMGYYDPILISDDHASVTILLDKTDVIDDDIETLSYHWYVSSGGVIHDALLRKPMVTFYDFGIYTITLVVTDSQGNSIEDAISIYVMPAEVEDVFVYPGSDLTVTQYDTVVFDGAYSLPSRNDLKYVWSIYPDSDDIGDEIDFLTPLDTHNLQLIFKSVGQYYFKLTAVNNKGGHFESELLTVNVVPATDNEPPIFISSLSTPFDCSETEKQKVTYSVIASDELHLTSFYLTLNGERLKGNEIIQTVLSGTMGKPTKIKIDYTVDPRLLPKDYQLIAYANDVNGPLFGVSRLLPPIDSGRCVIESFGVSEDVVQYGQNVVFSGTFTTPSQAWVLKLNAHETVTNQNQGVGNFDLLNINDLIIGENIVTLIAGNETATVSFIYLPETLDGMIYCDIDIGSAAVTDIEINSGVAPLPVISSGLFDLYGKIVYPGLSDFVRYKLMLNNSNDFRKNVTPGILDHQGYAHGNVGTQTEHDQIGVLDFTNLKNGIYTITLIAQVKIPAVSGVDEIVKTKHLDREFILNAPLKIGNLKFSQEDLVVNSGPIPLAVTRSYDSFSKTNKGAFGYGWHYSLIDLQLKLYETRVTINDHNGTYTTRLGGTYDRDVTLTLPDSGERVTFASQFVKTSFPGDWPHWEVRYVSPEGVSAKLHTKSNPIYGHDTLYFEDSTYGGTGYYWNGKTPFLRNSVNTSSHDISGWSLTLEDGSIYHIDRHAYGTINILPPNGFAEESLWSYVAYGKPYLSSVVLPNKDHIDFEVDLSDPENPKSVGVSNGTSNAFIKMAYFSDLAVRQNSNLDNLIQYIYTTDHLDVDGNGKVDEHAIEYRYDQYGNLTQVIKTNDYKEDNSVNVDTVEKVYYNYDENVTGPEKHQITSIVDSRGMQPIQYEYDDLGRLIATIDASGNRIVIERDLIGGDLRSIGGVDIQARSERVTDRNGNTSTYFYDQFGSVILGVDHMGYPTRYNYLYHQFENKEVPQQQRTETKKIVSDNGDGTFQWTTDVVEYDRYGHTHFTLNGVGNASVMTYDANGKITEIRQYIYIGDPNLDVEAVSWLNNRERFEIDFKQISTSRQYYDVDTGQLVLVGTTTGVDATEVWQSLTATLYDENRIAAQIVFDVDTLYTFPEPIEFEQIKNYKTLDSLDIKLNGQISSNFHQVTQYIYDAALSGSEHKPYQIINGNGISTYMLYDIQGREIQSGTQWVDLNGGNHKSVYTYLYYDSRGRIQYTMRETFDGLVPIGDASLSSNGVMLHQKFYTIGGALLYSVNTHGQVNENRYDAVGAIVETYTYQIESTDLPLKDVNALRLLLVTAQDDPQYNLLTISQILNDNNGQKILYVPPHDPVVVDDDATYAPVGVESVYDDKGRVIETRQWLGAKVNYTYDIDGNGDIIVKLPSDLGVTAHWHVSAYDGTPVVPDVNGEALLSYNRTQYDIASGVSKSYALNESGELVCQNKYGYDFLGRKITIASLPDTVNNVTHIGYSNGQKESVTDASGNITRYHYNDLGKLVKITFPPVDLDKDGMNNDLTFQYYGYDNYGRKIWETKQIVIDVTPAAVSQYSFAKDTIKRYYYNRLGQLVATELPKVDLTPHDNSRSYKISRYEYQYDIYGNQTEIRDNICVDALSGDIDTTNQRTTYFLYNHLGLKTSRKLPNGQIQYYAYDDNGQLQYSKDGNGQITEYIYYQGRLQYKVFYESEDAYSKNDPDVGYEYSYLKTGHQSKIEYYDYKNSLSIVDTTFIYDNQHRVVRMVTPEGDVNYTYNQYTGHKVSTYTGVDKTSAITRSDYHYDDLGRLFEISEVTRNGDTVSGDNVTTYLYDDNGNRKTKLLPNGVKGNYQYNKQNRLTTISYVLNNALMSQYEYALDSGGHRIGVVEQVHKVSSTSTYNNHNKLYAHDGLDRLIHEKVTNSATQIDAYDIKYKYDLVGNRIFRSVATLNSSCVTDYYYNDNDQLLLEVNSNPILSEHAYAYPVWVARNSAVEQMNNKYAHRYNEGDSASRHIVWVRLPSLYWQYAFWSICGLMTFMSFSICLLRVSGRRKLTQLISWMLVGAFLLGPMSPKVLATIDTQYQHLSTRMDDIWAQHHTTIAYQYDSNGAKTQKLTYVTGTVDLQNNFIEKIDYSYNVQGRLETVVSNDNTTRSEVKYIYNHAGLRVQKEVDGIVTVYLYDTKNHTGYAQILEKQSGTEQFVSYTIGDEVISESDGSDVHYLLHDGCGSVRHRSDIDGGFKVNSADGISSNTDQFDAYGNRLVEQYDSRLGFSGEYFDTDIQHSYHRARWYQPQHGRFNAVDTYAGDLYTPQSLHKYGYAHANPVNGIDPSGLMTLTSVMSNMTIMTIGGSLIGSAIGAAFGGAKEAIYGFLIGGSIGFGFATKNLKGVLKAGIWQGAMSALIEVVAILLDSYNDASINGNLIFDAFINGFAYGGFNAAITFGLKLDDLSGLGAVASTAVISMINDTIGAISTGTDPNLGEMLGNAALTVVLGIISNPTLLNSRQNSDRVARIRMKLEDSEAKEKVIGWFTSNFVALTYGLSIKIGTNNL